MTDARSIAVDSSNEAALDAWDGDDGAFWADHETYFDRSLARYDEALFAAASLQPADRVLDIGCGTGFITRQAARRTPMGDALGVDLSSRMLARARQRAADAQLTNVSFLQADAQVYPFVPESFDIALSRTGTMFFGDAGAAFANVARALRPTGRLVMLVWQPLVENEWLVSFTTALSAGRDTPPPPPDAPGPFSLGDPERVVALLEGAGFSSIDLDGLRRPMEFGRTADEAYDNVRSMGFTISLLGQLDADARADARAALRASIDAHTTPDGVLYRSAVWIVSAHR